MEEFCRKSHIVAGGHMTETPATMTYASAVFCETVCLDLAISVLKKLELKCVDVMNAYVTDPI